MLALFDISFKKFIAPTIAKIIYVLVMIGIALGYLAATIAAFSADAVAGLFVLIVVGPLLSLLYLCFFRVALESLISMILTAQNTTELVRMQQATQQPVPAHTPSATFPGSPSPSPQQPPQPPGWPY